MKSIDIAGYYWTEKELRDIATLPVGCSKDKVSICEYVSQEYNVQMTLDDATRLLAAIAKLPNAKPDKVKLALYAYEAAFVGAESFEKENLGADLAYLMAAILKGTQCEFPENRAIVQVLKLRLNKINKLAIFKHIKITGSECKRCGTTLDKKGYCKDITCPHSDYLQNETWTED